MADLSNQYRILFVIYESFHKDNQISISDLQITQELKFMHLAGNLNRELNYLRKTGYVEGPDNDLELTGVGLKTTLSIFQKFLRYIKRKYPVELSSWINNLEFNRSNSWELIRDSFFYIRREPLMREAFKEYLRDLESMENVLNFEIEEFDIETLIDDIFLNIYEVNNLFEHKFKHKLFCPPVPAQTFLRKATRGKQLKLTDFVATLASIIDGISHDEINSLLGTTKPANGSINKIKGLLDGKGIKYNADFIAKLRALHALRDKTFPIHDAGPEIIGQLQKLNLSFPLKNDKDEALKMLQAFNSCLLEMKGWFGS